MRKQNQNKTKNTRRNTLDKENSAKPPNFTRILPYTNPKHQTHTQKTQNHRNHPKPGLPNPSNQSKRQKTKPKQQIQQTPSKRIRHKNPPKAANSTKILTIPAQTYKSPPKNTKSTKSSKPEIYNTTIPKPKQTK